MLKVKGRVQFALINRIINVASLVSPRKNKSAHSRFNISILDTKNRYVANEIEE